MELVLVLMYWFLGLSNFLLDYLQRYMASVSSEFFISLESFLWKLIEICAFIFFCLFLFLSLFFCEKNRMRHIIF